MNVITGWAPWQGNRKRRRRRRRVAAAGMVCLVCAGLAPVWLASTSRTAEKFLWPLETRPRAITGTFMEARSAHYHSGLDLKTGGRIGLRLLAPADGWVARVRVSPRGYGKAIYLRSTDGSTLVFAHLSHLADPLQARVTRAQARDGVYEQDLRLAPGEIEVRRGDLLGLTGATGTGAPHLHLEVRSQTGRPLNPLLSGFSVPDHEAPQVRRLRLVPAEEATRIGGQARARVVGIEETVEAVGLLAVQVDVVDKTGVYDHSLMPLGMSVALDGEEVYFAEQQGFEFVQGRQMRLEIVRDPRGSRRRWFRLYRRPGNDLPGRRWTHESATCRVPDDGGRHRLEVRAWDAVGNVDSAGIWLQAPAPVSGAEAGAAGLEASVRSRDLDWNLDVTPGESVVEVLARSPAPVAPADLATLAVEVHAPHADRPTRLPVTVLPDGQGVCAAVDLGRLGTGANRFRLVAPDLARALVEEIRVLVLAPDLPGRVELAGGELSLADGTGRGLFPGGVLWAEAVPAELALPEGTRRQGTPWRLQGAGAALRGELEVQAHLDPALEGPVGLFRVDGRGRWSFLGGERVVEAEGAVFLRGELDDLGTVVALRDDHPPYLGAFQMEGRTVSGSRPLLRPVAQRDRDGVTLPRWPVLELPLADPGAGLEPEGVVCELDGQPYPARWDPEEERVYFELYVDPGAGVHRARVEATDRLGNTSETSLEFELREL